MNRTIEIPDDLRHYALLKVLSDAIIEIVKGDYSKEEIQTLICQAWLNYDKSIRGENRANVRVTAIVKNLD